MLPGGRIESESIANWAWDVHFNKKVKPEAALVHGCKDGTLLDALLAAQKPKSTVSEPHWTDAKEASHEEKATKAMEARSKLLKAREGIVVK